MPVRTYTDIPREARGARDVRDVRDEHRGRFAAPALLVVTLLLAGLLSAAPAGAAIEGYPGWQGASKCRPQAKPGTVALGTWIVRRYGGGYGGISRSCSGRTGTSEHHEGRAFDWMVDATTRDGRQRARAFLKRIRATDRYGNEHALARRMGIMYVIWDDEIYSAWNGYRPERYLNSGCKRIKKCSKTLRHRDHVHVSLTRRAARAKTSWYERRAARH